MQKLHLTAEEIKERLEIIPAILEEKIPEIEEKIPDIPVIKEKIVDQEFNAVSENAQSGKAVAEAIASVPQASVDQSFNSESTNAQSGTAVTEAINNKTIYSNSEPLLSDIGGIKASEHATGFNNVAITDLITELLYPYTTPVIGALTLNPAAGVKEKGVSITVNSASVKVTKKSKPIEKVDLYRGSTLLATSTQEVSSSGTTVSFNNLNDTLDGNTNTTYYAKVSELNGGTDVVSSNAAYTFVNPYYCGVITKGAEITAELVAGLTKKIETKGTKNYSYTTTAAQCAVIAYPASYGVIKTIKDQNNFTQTWTQHTISINGVNYYVYVSGSAAATNFKYTFSY